MFRSRVGLNLSFRTVRCCTKQKSTDIDVSGNTHKTWGAFHYAKDSGNFGRNFGRFWRSVLVPSDLNIRGHLCSGGGPFISVGIFQPKFAVPVLINRYLTSIRKFGKGIKSGKSHSYWLARFNRKMSFHFHLVFLLISDRSVWHFMEAPLFLIWRVACTHARMHVCMYACTHAYMHTYTQFKGRKWIIGCFHYSKDSGNPFRFRRTGIFGISITFGGAPLISVGIFRPKFAFPFLTNPFFALLREFGKETKSGKSQSYWLARKMFRFPLVFPLISDRSVWHNGKHP